MYRVYKVKPRGYDDLKGENPLIPRQLSIAVTCSDVLVLVLVLVDTLERSIWSIVLRYVIEFTYCLHRRFFSVRWLRPGPVLLCACRDTELAY